MLIPFLLSASAAPLLEQQLQQLVQPALDQDVIGALIIGVVRKGEVSFHSFGTLADGKRPTQRDRFEIGSISKAFNGMLLADAVVRGEVFLDDPADKFLDWHLPKGPKGESITLKHLATHTSGWPRLPQNFSAPDPADPYATFQLQQLQLAATSTALLDTPGASYAYSNLGASVLGAALAKAANLPWERLVQERLSKPMRLKDLEIDLGNVVQGHNIDRQQVPQWTLAAFAPTGGIEASANDLTTLIIASLVPGGTLRDVFDLALTPTVDLGPAGHMGLGWHITAEGIRWHNGETGGFHSLIALHSERQIGVVVLSDTATEIVDEIGFSALEMLAGQNVAPLSLPKTIESVPLKSLQQRVGTWGPATIRLHNEHLVWTEDGVSARMWPTNINTFVIRRPHRTLTFSGEVLEIEDGVSPIRITRTP